MEKWDAEASEAAANELNRLKTDIRAEEQALQAKQHKVELLQMELYAKCDHSFQAPIKGYEHEGGTCMFCKVNELYAPRALHLYESFIAVKAAIAPPKPNTMIAGSTLSPNLAGMQQVGRIKRPK